MADFGAIGLGGTGFLMTATSALHINDWWADEVVPVTLGTLRQKTTAGKVLAIWASDDPRGILGVPTDGSLIGVVQENGVPFPGVKLRCHYAPNGFVINNVIAADDGSFHFDLLEKGADKYYVIAFDPPGGVEYNAKIVTKSLPV